MYTHQMIKRLRRLAVLVLLTVALIVSTMTPTAMMQERRPSQIKVPTNVQTQRARNRTTVVRLPTTTVQTDPRLHTIKKRTPVAYKPFELLDPRDATKHIDAKTVLTLPNGHKMTAGDYYAQLNKFEAQLAPQGYSLRDPGDKPQVLSDPVIRQSQLRQQGQAISNLQRKVSQGAGRTARTKALASFMEQHYSEQKKLPSGAAQLPNKSGSITNWRLSEGEAEKMLEATNAQRQAQTDALAKKIADKFSYGGGGTSSSKSGGGGGYVPPADVGFPKTPIAAAPPVAGQVGDPASFAPYFKTASTVSVLGYSSSATIGLYALGQDLQALQLKSSIGISSGGMNAYSKLLFFGQEVEGWGYQSGGKDLNDVDETPDSSKGDPKYPPITQTYTKDVEYRFVVVFVPVVVQLSVNATVSLTYSGRFKPKDKIMSLHLVPSVNAWVTAKAGVDIDVAGAGFYGFINPVLFDEMTFDVDTASRSYSCFNKFDALGGEFGLYAYIYLPAFNLPPWKLHEYNWPVLASGSAFSDEGVVFDGTW